MIHFPDEKQKLVRSMGSYELLCDIPPLRGEVCVGDQ